MVFVACWQVRFSARLGFDLAAHSDAPNHSRSLVAEHSTTYPEFRRIATAIADQPDTSMGKSHSSSQRSQSQKTTPPSQERTPLAWIGLGLLHVGTAGWIGYGAAVKALDFNPLLLPLPIRQVVEWVGSTTSVDQTALLTWTLRGVIGAEIFLALTILLSTRFARAAAITTLGFFCVILLIAMGQTAAKDGLVKALTGGCGCFGEDGLPASVMFAIDLALMLSAWLLVPKSRSGSIAPVAASLAIGSIAVFAVPEPEILAPQPDSASQVAASNGNTAPTPPVETPEASGGSKSAATVPTPAANATTQAATQAATQAGTQAAISGPWPGPPTKYDKIYFPKWKEWVGKPLRDQKLPRAIEGPMPSDFEKGEWLVVFSRQDCEDCQSMYRAYFNEKRPERVMKVTVPDSRGTPIAMPCIDCEQRTLYRVKAGETEKGKSPEYVFRTPVIVRMKDGIVTGVCTDRSIAEEFNSVFPNSDSARNAAKPSAPSTPALTWPGPPEKLAPFYVAEFEKSVGKPLADQAFARLIENKLPANFLNGRWIIVFFREDCDHCFELLSTHFGGKLKWPTLTVAIPDADPNNILGNPCDECAKVSMIKGPNYVIGTPIVLAIKDGVVECVVDNVDDMAALEACLQFK